MVRMETNYIIALGDKIIGIKGYSLSPTYFGLHINQLEYMFDRFV